MPQVARANVMRQYNVGQIFVELTQAVDPNYTRVYGVNMLTDVFIEIYTLTNTVQALESILNNGDEAQRWNAINQLIGTNRRA